VAFAAVAAADPAYGAYTFVSKWGPSDPGFIESMQPTDGAVDASGRVYVADVSFPRSRVLGFDSSGVMVRKFGGLGNTDGRFNGVSGIATDPAGNVYGGDRGNCRVQKFDSAAQFLTKWGTCGSGDGQFGNSGITEVAYAPNGYLYVTDEALDRVQEFTSTGGFVRKWGSPGSGPGQFSDPTGVAVDSAGNVYVADYANIRIQKFDDQGNYLAEWPAAPPSSGAPIDISVGPGDLLYVSLNSDRIRVYDTAGNHVGGWGSQGIADGQFQFLASTAVSPTSVYAIETTSGGRVQIFDLVGNFQSKWGDYGNTGDGQFRMPWAIDSGPTGDAYVVDQANSRVQRFDRDGTFISKWGTMGSGPGQFSSPIGIAASPSGDVYVADQLNNRVQRFDFAGSYIGEWPVTAPAGAATDAAGNVYVSTIQGTGSRVKKFSPGGSLLADWSAGFLNPQGLAVDGAGNVWVADTFRHQVKKLDSTGALVGTFGGLGGTDGTYFFPYDIDVDLSGEVFVADSRNDRVQKLSPSGSFLGKWGSLGLGDGQFEEPRGIAVDDTGDILVSDMRNYRIQKFRDTTGYARPKSATPNYIPLVNAYQPCGVPNRMHALPLGYGSCTPPAMTSSYLTVGTPESNARLANLVASVKTAVVAGDTSTPADEADIQFTVSIKDVRRATPTLEDYTGTVEMRIPLQITDRLNSPYPAGRSVATTQEIGFSFAVPCAPTDPPADTTIGAFCSLATSADAIAPGAAVEGARANWEIGPVRVYDGGTDEDATTPGDNTLYLHQGVVVP
jgi:streptogramin lyase